MGRLRYRGNLRTALPGPDIANNTFFALQGAQDDTWLRSPEWKQYRDVRRVMEQRQLSVSIIQAINRVRCRRVIDAEGRSPNADIFIVLPKDKDGDAILQDISSDMPGLNVVDWQFELDGPKVRRPRKGTSHEALISFMGNRLPGPDGMRALRTVLRDKEHATTKALQQVGVEYVTRGQGRGAKSFLVKHAPA